MSGVNLQIDAAALEPLIRRVVEQTIAAMEADRALLGDRLAIPEAEAAALIGLQYHQLRDERRDGRIRATFSRGRRVLYTRQDLLAYLAERRWHAEGNGKSVRP